MGVAYLMVSEHEVDGFDPVEAIPDGKSIARASGHLFALAAAAGVPPLEEFTSMPPEDAAAFGGWVTPEDREPGLPYPEFGGDEPPGPDQYPAEAWFEPSTGLATVRALLTAVEATRRPSKPQSTSRAAESGVRMSSPTSATSRPPWSNSTPLVPAGIWRSTSDAT